MIWLLTQCFKLLSVYIYTAFHPDTVLVGGNSRHCGEICRRSGAVPHSGPGQSPWLGVCGQSLPEGERLLLRK